MEVKLSQKEHDIIERHLSSYMKSDEAVIMKSCIQHGNVTTYEHVMNVVAFSCWLSKKVKLDIDEESLVIGAYLHDFYLYDWHKDNPGRLHGLTHPKAALENAESKYDLNDKVKNIIISHMWPLTVLKFPKYREALIVCFADKYCAMCETFHL